MGFSHSHIGAVMIPLPNHFENGEINVRVNPAPAREAFICAPDKRISEVQFPCMQWLKIPLGT